MAALDRVGDPGHVLKKFLDLAGFPIELCLLVEVLVLAAAAFAKERADGLGTIRGRLDHFQQVGTGVVLVVAKDPCANEFAGETEGDKDDPAEWLALVVFLRRDGYPSDSVAQIAERFDAQLDLLMVCERVGVEFLGRAWHRWTGR